MPVLFLLWRSAGGGRALVNGASFAVSPLRASIPNAFALRASRGGPCTPASLHVVPAAEFSVSAPGRCAPNSATGSAIKLREVKRLSAAVKASPSPRLTRFALPSPWQEERFRTDQRLLQQAAAGTDREGKTRIKIHARPWLCHRRGSAGRFAVLAHEQGASPPAPPLFFARRWAGGKRIPSSLRSLACVLLLECQGHAAMRSAGAEP